MSDDRAEAALAVTRAAIERLITEGDAAAERHLRDCLHALSATGGTTSRELKRRPGGRRKARG